MLRDLRIQLRNLAFDEGQSCLDLALQNGVGLSVATIPKAGALLDQTCARDLQILEFANIQGDRRIRFQSQGRTHPGKAACIDRVGLGACRWPRQSVGPA
jgi:hypothetical protein